MALSTCPITGRLPLSEEQSLTDLTLSFTLSDWDSEGDAILMPAKISVPLESDGSLPEGFTLWRNSAGSRASHYVAQADWAVSDHPSAMRKSVALGRLQIGTAASYSLADLLLADAPAAEKTYWSSLTQTEYAQISAASAALGAFTADGYLAAVEAARDDARAAGDLAIAAQQTARDAARSAETARDDAIAAAAWTYQVLTDADLAALEAPAEGDRALVLSSLHVWRYAAGAWAQETQTPLAKLRADLAGVGRLTEGASAYLGGQGAQDSVEIIVAQEPVEWDNAVWGSDAYGPLRASPGGYLARVSAQFSGAGGGRIEVLAEDGVLLALIPVTWSAGEQVWSEDTDYAPVFVPSGGHVLLRRLTGEGMRFSGAVVAEDDQLVVATEGFAQIDSLGERQGYKLISTVRLSLRLAYRRARRTLDDDLPQRAPALIDHRFAHAGDWLLNGAQIGAGGLVSLANNGWGPECYPALYGHSQLSQRSLGVTAQVTAAGQIWGLSWRTARPAGGYDLAVPAAVVDGAEGVLRLHKYGVDPARLTLEIPWEMQGAEVRLEMNRRRFVTELALTNLGTGEKISGVLDYAVGAGADSGRAWGTPTILFPFTSAGGVIVQRLRMAAERPFPTGGKARVICLGDSITEGSEIENSAHEACWSYRLEDARAARGAQDVAILARSGQTAAQLARAMPEALALCGRDTLAILMIGANDAATLGDLASWRAHVAAMTADLRRRGARVALACLPPLPHAAAVRAAMNADILSGYFPDALCPPIRFDLALGDGETWKEGLHTGDQTHPSVAGNEAMLNRLRIDLPEAFE